MQNKLKNINTLTPSVAKGIKVVFTDIDDTLTLNGKLLREAYDALWDLHINGIKVVPITGRCAGWVDHIARMWPVEGVVGENGAFYAYMKQMNDSKKLVKRYYLNPEEIKESKRKFELIKKEVFARFPTAALASDQKYREFDLAIDYCEDVPPLSQKDVEEIVKIFEKYGATTKVSSIHINGWFGDYDKLKMTKIFAKEVLRIDLEKEPESAIFCGDSPNDQPMFAFFPHSVGMKNIDRFLGMIEDKPEYITNKPGSLGFAEFTRILLERRMDEL